MKRLEAFLNGAVLVESTVHTDERGFFKESYNKRVWHELGIQYEFTQDNVSKSTDAGTIRGLHFQRNLKAQTKLIHVINGAVFDVIVDLRQGSPTYKEWKGVILSEFNQRQLLVPKGFAHGFCTLVPNTIVIYKVDAYYDPAYDSGIRWDDDELNINWPVTHPVLSEKDRSLPSLQDGEHHFTFGENEA